MKKRMSNSRLFRFLAAALAASWPILFSAGCAAPEPPRTQAITSDQELLAAGANRTSIRADLPKASSENPQEDAPAAGGSAVSGEATAAASFLDAGQAQSIALSHAGVDEENALHLKTGQDYDDGRFHYDVEFLADGMEYEYKIDAATGEILEYGFESAETGSGDSKASGQDGSAPSGAGEGEISEEQAMRIALDLAPGAGESHIRIGSGYDGGRRVYEGKIVYQGMEYEFEIDAATGTVLEWDAEPWP